MDLRWPVMIRRVHGHSMLPVLPPGTLIIGLRWLRKPRAQRVAVFDVNGREVVKRIARVEDAELFIVGDHAVASTDSRQYGTVPTEQLLATVIYPRTRRA